VKSGGIIHLFTEVEGEDPLNKIKDMYPNVIFARIVRSVKPKVYHVVVDIRK